MYIIGIDPGTATGIAIWCRKDKKFLAIQTMKIHEAMQLVKDYHHIKKDVMVRMEDARLRKWFGNAGREQLQGAGSIKRDCNIWEDYLKDLSIPFDLVAPKSNKTKLSKDYFTTITGWNKVTSVHARDAAMLVVGF